MVSTSAVEFELLGWPADGPTLRLDYRRFSYAGKFVMSNTGKAVLKREGKPVPSSTTDSTPVQELPYATAVLAAVAFNEDRTDESTLWLRYVTVDSEFRGQGLGPKLISRVRDLALERGYESLQIAVNNPFAYDALWKAGFTFTGETTGLAELILVHPVPTPATGTELSPSAGVDDRLIDRYRTGLEQFRSQDRDLSPEERRFLERRLENGPPSRST
ncbi:GNAT family N-acetyltransferase [Halobacteria archaeon AArc-curdl1]|uniref:GNAT family N-acetyltransferase n=1 Tax=Natronosalvus hydrolyticus TaxID=2979988 RepID=A0AAP2Z490_9EURY|nr:GNAT family N-acetyltransferase [Halobacteria archaeon AArc-curdl1]